MATDVVHKLVIRGTMPKSGREGRIGTSLHIRNTLSVEKVSPAGRKLYCQAFILPRYPVCLVKLLSRLLRQCGSGRYHCQVP